MSVKKVAAAVAMMSCAVFPARAGGGRIDDMLYAQYAVLQGGRIWNFSVCGHTKNTLGCFGGGGSDLLEQACAFLEGPPTYKKNTVTRAIYVLDKRLSKSDPMILYIYSRKDTITDNDDTIDFEFQREVFLGIKGGSKAQCHMAANTAFVYAGSNLSADAVSVDKANFTVTALGGPNVSSITADDRGYVSMNFTGGNLSFAPDGTGVSEGGGTFDFVNSHVAWTPKL